MIYCPGSAGTNLQAALSIRYNDLALHRWVDVDSEPVRKPKPELQKKKVMLSIWWSVDGIDYFELLLDNVTVTGALYAAQLDRLNFILKLNRSQQYKVCLLHDNACPYVSKLTRNKIIDLGREQLPHPSYSSDIALSDYCLFRSLKHRLKDRKFEDRKSLEIKLRHFFTAQPASF